MKDQHYSFLVALAKRNSGSDRPRIFRGVATGFNRFFSHRDLDLMLTAYNVSPFFVRLMSRHKQLDPKDLFNTAQRLGFLVQAVDQPTVMAELNRGAVLNINHLQLRHSWATGVAQALSWETNSLVHINAYYGSSGSKGFVKHTDDYPVFIVQLEGYKEWWVYSENPRKLLLHTVLEAGDVLYIPRKFFHRARTPKGTLSLHLTVGMKYLRYDYLVKLLAKHMQNNPIGKGLPKELKRNGRLWLPSVKKWIKQSFTAAEIINFLSGTGHFDLRFSSVALGLWQGQTKFRSSQAFRLIAWQPFKLHIIEEPPEEAGVKFYFRGALFTVPLRYRSAMELIASEPTVTYRQLRQVAGLKSKDLSSWLKQLVLRGVIEVL